MEIMRNDSIAKWLMDEIRMNLGKQPREHIHLSDLLTPRKAYFNRTNPKYATDKEIMYWVTGRGHEDALHYVSGYEHGETMEWNGIYYTPDIFQNIPIEIKTRRRQLAENGKEAETYDHYLKQLKGYCAITQKPRGWLWVWCLVSKEGESGKTIPELACYEVDFTKEELEEERGRLIQMKEALGNALRIKDHKNLPLCPYWMCGKMIEKIDKKAYCKECDKEFERKDGGEKHLKSQIGKGHTVTKAVMKYEYIMECKYFHLCEPFDIKNVNALIKED